MDQRSLPQKKCQDELQPWHGEGKQLLDDFFATFSPVSPTNPPNKSLERETKRFGQIGGLIMSYITYTLLYDIIICLSIFTYLSIILQF